MRSRGIAPESSLVVVQEHEKFRVLDGNHRLAALRVLNYASDVPCVVIPAGKDELDYVRIAMGKSSIVFQGE
jgi:ParB-like chromosome segregation protein Spo0J